MTGIAGLITLHYETFQRDRKHTYHWSLLTVAPSQAPRAPLHKQGFDYLFLPLLGLFDICN